MGSRILKLIVGLYLGITGAFMLLLLAVDSIDPEWAREAKAANPLGPDEIPSWFYVIASIATAACLGGAWKLIKDAITRAQRDPQKQL